MGVKKRDQKMWLKEELDNMQDFKRQKLSGYDLSSKQNKKISDLRLRPVQTVAQNEKEINQITDPANLTHNFTPQSRSPINIFGQGQINKF